MNALVAGASALSGRHSLRSRGLLATLALLIYLVAAGLYIANGRDQIYESTQSLERLSRHEKALALAEASVTGVLMHVTEASNSGQAAPELPSDLRQTMAETARLFAALEEHDPAYVLLKRAIERSYGELQTVSVLANWTDLGVALRRAADDLEIHHRLLEDQRFTLSSSFQRQYDAVTVESLFLAIFGLGTFGPLAAWFFTRLAHDIRRLEEHASQIVRGTRGIEMEVRRDDELGHLMRAVNRMSAELDLREKQIALDAENRSHQDKMLAVAALAAGVAHEVNNPLAVISGVAQELQSGSVAPERLVESAQLILAQVQRASHAARQLAEVAAPQPAELDWLDFNVLLRQATQMMGYDRRYRRFAFDLRADPALPAVRSSASALQQVLIQLLSLICTAMAERSQASGLLLLITLPEPGGVSMQILFPPVLDFNRSEVQRSLLLSRATVEPLRGRLAFDQVPGSQQSIRMHLPADASRPQG